MRPRPTWVLLPALVVVAGCTSSGAIESPTASPAPPRPAASTSSAAPAPPATPAEQAEQAATAAYESFWRVRNEANAAPGSRDWEPIISQYTADPARYFALETIQAYADVPAHFEGEPKRAPRVEDVSLAQPPRVVIIDCIDVTGTEIVRDDTGESVVDPNQPPRYQLRAEVVLYPGPERWLVQETEPMLEQSC